MKKLIVLSLAAFSLVSLSTEVKAQTVPCPEPFPSQVIPDLKENRAFLFKGQKFELSAASWEKMKSDYFPRTEEYHKPFDLTIIRGDHCFYEIRPKSTGFSKTIELDVTKVKK